MRAMQKSPIQEEPDQDHQPDSMQEMSEEFAFPFFRWEIKHDNTCYSPVILG
jgi:hypothetical protein